MANNERIATTLAEEREAINRLDIDPSVKTDLLASIDTLEAAADTAAEDITACANRAQTQQDQVIQLRDEILRLPAVGVVSDILSDPNINKELAAWMTIDGTSAIVSGGSFEEGTHPNDTFVADPNAIDPGGLMGAIPPGKAIGNAHNWARGIQKIAFGMQHASNSAVNQFADEATNRELLEGTSYGQRRLNAIHALLFFAVGELLQTLVENVDGVLLIDSNGEVLVIDEVQGYVDILSDWYSAGGFVPSGYSASDLSDAVSNIMQWLAGSYHPRDYLSDIAAGSDGDASHHHAPVEDDPAGGGSTDYRLAFEALNDFINASQDVNNHAVFTSNYDSHQFDMAEQWAHGVGYIDTDAWTNSEYNDEQISGDAFAAATGKNTAIQGFGIANDGDPHTAQEYLDSVPGFREGDWETTLAGYESFFTHYFDEFEAQARAVGDEELAASLPNPDFIHPANGQIAWWTDEQMGQWASIDGSAFDSLIAGTRRTLMDARAMYIGSEVILRSVWPQWNGAKELLEDTPTNEWDSMDVDLYEDAPGSYSIDFRGGLASQTVEVSADRTGNNAGLRTYDRSVKIKLPTEFQADPFTGLTEVRWGDNFENINYTDTDGTEFTMGPGRQGFRRFGWCGSTLRANLLKQTWTSVNKTKVEAFQAALYTWMQSLMCIVNAAVDFNNTVDTTRAALRALHDEHEPSASWYDAIIPNWISAPATESDEQRAIQSLRRRIGRTLTIGGLLESNVERLIFKEQCFLLSYIVPISKYKKEYLEGTTQIGEETVGNIKPKKVAFSAGPEEGNACQLLDGEGYGFVNRLVVTPGYNRINDIPHSELSNLTPMIRLFKIYSSENAGSHSQLEFQFESNFGSLKDANPSFDPATVLSNRRRRGAGVGIKNFSFAYDGSNPFAVKKSIKATLEIFANTFDDLLEQRQTLNNALQGKSYRYIDLALKTGGGSDSTSDESCGDGAAAIYRTQEQNNNLAYLNFRLKAVVGWARPPHLAQRTEDQELLNAIYDSYVTLDLTPTVHEFNFDEQGRVVMKIDYLAYIEDFYDQTSFNVFANSYSGDSSLTTKSIQRELNLEYWTKKCSSSEVNDIRDQYSQEVNNEKRIAVQKLFQTLMNKEKVYYVNLTYEEVGKFLRKGPFATELANGGWMGANGTAGDSDDFVRSITQNRGDVIAQINEATNSSVRQAFAAAAAAEADETATEMTNAWKASLFAGGDPDNQVLSYFYASDLVDIILENIETELKTLPNLISRMRPPESGDQQATTLFNCKRHTKEHSVRQMQDSFKRLRLLLGPVEIVNQADVSEVYQANLGDMPISTKYFIEWLTDKMLTNKETVYPLTSFMNDFFNEIVRSFLNNDMCFNWNVSQNVRVQQAAIASYGGSPASNIDPIRGGTSSTTGRYKVSDFNAGLPILKLSPSSNDPNQPMPLSQLPVGNQFQYLVYFCGRINPSELMKGNKSEDEAKGIHHFLLGAEKGLVKNIELQKTQTPGLAEVRFEQESYDGLRQLRVVYDAFITTYANVKVYPGTYIYIDPGGFSPNSVRYSANEIFNLTQYGIGGYYMVIKSENNLAAGLSETKITAKWVHQIEALGEQEGRRLAPSATGRRAVAKCSTASSRSD